MTGFQGFQKRPSPGQTENLTYRLQVLDGDRLMTELQTNVPRALIGYLEDLERNGGREV